jgi:hypothetical protein
MNKTALFSEFIEYSCYPLTVGEGPCEAGV